MVLLFFIRMTKGPIGVFDSGYGGLTVLKEIEKVLPGYDYLYMGDNARAPYGTRSFETVYEYTWQCLQWFFKQGCHFVILACNTASAKALRNIQQKDLVGEYAGKKVLGVIRPTTECIGNYTNTRHIGILGTTGTVKSNSYKIEIERFFKGAEVFQEACPMWVPIIENNEYDKPHAQAFIKMGIDNILAKSNRIDVLLLACTHYPLIAENIKQFVPKNISVVSQGLIVAESLKDYLQRHPEVDAMCTQNGNISFYTTDSAIDFNEHASRFYGKAVSAVQVHL